MFELIGKRQQRTLFQVVRTPYKIFVGTNGKTSVGRTPQVKKD